MKTLIDRVSVGDRTVACVFESEQPILEIDEKAFFTIDTVVKELPQLSSPDHLVSLAKIANFLFKGINYRYIENIAIFQRDYRKRLRSEAEDASAERSRIRDFGVFDVSQMHEPYLENGKLVFFVKQETTGLPYKVSLDYPVRGGCKHSYELLPYGPS